MKVLQAVVLSLFIGLLGMSCQPVDTSKENDRLLAKVHNKTLYVSELDGMFPEGTTSKDSSVIINAYLDRWIRDMLLLYEAERNIPSDLNIDKLVRDYRASLISHTYEKILVEEKLDSTVSKAELEAFYEKNKEQYQLETPIIRCYFIKLKLPVPNATQLRQLWNSDSSEDFEKLANYCNQYAESHLLADSAWYRVEDIAANLPPGTLTADNVAAKRDFSQRDGEYQYYFKVFELKNRKDIAPLSYIEGQARKFILHQRKVKLLEDIREKMYEVEQRKNNITVYTE